MRLPELVKKWVKRFRDTPQGDGSVPIMVRFTLRSRYVEAILSSAHPPVRNRRKATPLKTTIPTI